MRGRWPDPRALTYAVEPEGGQLEPQLFREQVERAVSAWNELGPVRLSPAPVADADVVLRWGDMATDENPEGLFGRDTSVAMTGPVASGTFVAFHPRRTWIEGGGDEASFAQAALHELGHALGLGHSAWPASLMYSAREEAGTTIDSATRAGLASLYATTTPRVGDFVAGERALLRGVGRDTGWLLFDTDGDGDDELCVWSEHAEDRRAWMAFHFTFDERVAGPVLARTSGRLHQVGGSRVAAVVEDGERRLYVERSPEICVRFVFDPLGRPLDAVRIEAPEWPERGSEASGDLDGNGTPELVRRLSDS